MKNCNSNNTTEENCTTLKSYDNRNNVSNNESKNLYENESIFTANIEEKPSSNINNRNRKSRKRLITNESADTSIVSSKKHEIPDGGYGWVIVFSSFCISLIADGISFSFGLLYTEFLAYFKESKSKTAWIGSLFLAVPLLLGPIMSNLVEKYGCRKMTIIGGITSSIGFALGSICNSVEMLYITFGVISGIGLGIGYVTAVVSIAFWFDKKRTFATGIGASGTGIGTFLYAPFTAWLIDYYGWRGTTLILAGTMLNAVVFGALMRDPDWLIDEEEEDSIVDSRCQSEITLLNCDNSFVEVKKLIDDGVANDVILDSLVTTCNTKNNQIKENYFNIDYKIRRSYSEEFVAIYRNNSSDEIQFKSNAKNKNEIKKQLLFLPSKLSSLSTITSKNSINYNNNNESNKTNKYLASAESLSPSEKISLSSFNNPFGDAYDSINPFTLKHINYKETGDLEDINLQCNSIRRRLSLNENLICCSRNTIAVAGNSRQDLRRNTLDVLKIDGKDLNKILICNDAINNIKTNLGKNEKNLRNCKIKKENKTNTRRSNYLKTRNSLKNQQCFQHFRVHRNSIITTTRGAKKNISTKHKLMHHMSSSCPNIFNNDNNNSKSLKLLTNNNNNNNLNNNKNIEEKQENIENWRSNLLNFLKSVCDFSLYFDIKFSLFNFSTLFLFIWYIVPYFYITEYMIEYNYTEEDSAFLLSVIGIFNTIGMILLGFFGDRPWLNVNIMYSICMLFCGLSIMLMPFAINCYYSLIGLSIVFGLTFASTFSFTPSILVSLVDLDDFTSAYGLILLTEGIGSLLGPPLAALIYDYTLKWDASFYTAGIFISFSGVLSYIVELLERRDRQKATTDNGIILINNNVIKKDDKIAFV